MRRILVEFARSRGRNKRGGDVHKVEFDEALVVSPQRGTDLAALDDALNALAAMDEKKAKVIELRFFGGLSVEETAEVLAFHSAPFAVSLHPAAHITKRCKAYSCHQD